MNRPRPLHDWGFWAFLLLLCLTLFFAVAGAFQTNWIFREMKEVKQQNIWSIEDRAILHEDQAYTRDRLKYLTDFVDAVKAEADRRRRQQEKER